MIGIIGTGNMGYAFINAFIRGGIPASEIVAFDINGNHRGELANKGVSLTSSVKELLYNSDTVMLAIKPQHFPALFESIGGDIKGKSVISIAAGITMKQLGQGLPNAKGILRIMPNLPVMVGSGMIALASNHTLDDGSFNEIRKMLDLCGKTILVPESLFDAITAISGSGTALVYMFLGAVADAAVFLGIPHTEARAIAAQMVLGSCQYFLEKGEHSEVLKDAVCSPGGTTIHAVRTLEKSGFRSSVIEGMIAAAERAKNLK